MKRSAGILFIFLIFFSFISCSYAASLGNQIDGAANNLEGKVNTVENIVSSSDQEKKDYLIKQWENILVNKPIFRQLILGYKVFSPYTDPVIEFAVGVTPSLSWIFLLTLFIWFLLVKYYSQIYDALYYFSSFSPRTSLIITLCLFVIFLILNFFQMISIYLANLVVSSISKLGEWYVQLFILIIVFMVIIIIGRFSKQIRVVLRAKKIARIREMKEAERDAEFSRMKMTTDAIQEIFKGNGEGI